MTVRVFFTVPDVTLNSAVRTFSVSLARTVTVILSPLFPSVGESVHHSDEPETDHFSAEVTESQDFGTDGDPQDQKHDAAI